MKFYILLIFAAIVMAQHVVELDRKTFDKFVAAHEYVLVEFYSPDCGHCKSLAPELELAAKVLSEDELFVAKVDATQEKVLAAKHKVTSYPSLYFYAQGYKIPYTGPRDHDGIVNWVQYHAKPFLRRVQTDEELRSFQEPKGLYYFDPVGRQADRRHLQTIGEISITLESTPLYHISEALRSIYNVPENVNFAVKTQTALKFYDGTIYTQDLLRKFIESHIYPLVIKFSAQERERLLENYDRAVFYWEAQENQEFRDMFALVAEQYRGKLQFVVIGHDDQGGEKRFLNLLQSSQASKGALYIVNLKNTNRYRSESLDSESLRDFIESYETQKPLTLSEFQRGSVIELDADNFHFFVKSAQEDILIEFYAPWCGHCKALTPIYEELAQKTQPLKHLIIAKIDATAHQIPGFHIEGFPTLFYYKKHPATAIHKHEDQRNLQSLVSFIKKHYAHEWVDLGIQEPAEEESDDHVKIVTTNNFERVVWQSTANVLLEFYAPWCGHCKNLTPIYSQLAERLKDDPTVVIAKVDATQHQLPGVNIRGYPTIKLFKKIPTVEVVDYEGPRTVEGFVEFLKGHRDDL